MRFDIKGLVLRETPVRDNDRYLDILTAEMGRISVYGRGVRSYKSKNMEATMPLCYSTFTLERQKEDFIVLTEAEKLDAYNDSRLGLEINSLCMYVCETVREVSLPNEDQSRILRLALNTLHALTNSLYDRDIIKAAFEMRLMSEAGYMPDLSSCGGCGRNGEGCQLDVMNGVLLCSECAEKRLENPEEEGTKLILAPLSSAAVEALRYIIRAPLNRLFAFRCDHPVPAELSAACEQYILNHLERNFPTLIFYKQVGRLPKPTTDKE
ncbi:MAG: DNA repair protein RecO [Clostridia bacterium]|nr:DNA repair protein RecO [Clostridia bacterium]